MRDEDGRYFCDQCRRRCRAGGLQVHELGSIESRRANRDTDAIYCSERCLRDRLMNVRPDEDPEEALQRQLDAERDRHQATRERADELYADLDRVTSLISETPKLLPAVPDSEAGQRLKRTLINANKILEKRWGRGRTY